MNTFLNTNIQQGMYSVLTRIFYTVLDKKTSNIYKWKEKVQKNTGRRRKVQITKAAFKGLHRFVFFTAESLPILKHNRVSEVFKRSKIHDFEYYDERKCAQICDRFLNILPC